METYSSPSRPTLSRRASRPALMLGLVGLVVSIPLWSDRSLGSGPTLARRLDDAPAVQTPPGDSQDKDDQEMARLALRDNCLICHSEEMVISQRLTQPQWKAEVEKMVGFGSPLPPDQTDTLITYLSEQYSDSTPSALPARIRYTQALEQVKPTTAEIPPHGSQADQGATLFATHCAACHAPTAQGLDLGPNLVEVATLLRPADFLNVVRTGRHRMPGFQLILNPDQEKDILAWLQSKRYATDP
ncbi:c-type cytochrome [Singulisphaera acidiphila]|uniref:Cytochrome c, mono-and diheme variants family n=1 Tax=Singulisphaera acidiphila (strain ATCC BAA-1392 / DSM 18658 / VKM B-2454 / MOB10) TaxID=886293 RepID=L0DBX0_SINAD|nr:c-type cytochrome [Singulisphaera acidiphila]AGA26166.1 cytochrome c, mono- and diheme variants family [Singulisphaera acidiphila DSM 18658]